jgi:transcriptional regulator with XRE-family HTH domain
MTIATDYGYSEALAAEVRAMAARKSVHHKDIAAALGLSPMAVSRRMSGETPWTVTELYIAARTLGCGIRDLLPQMDSNHQHFDYRFEYGGPSFPLATLDPWSPAPLLDLAA